MSTYIISYDLRKQRDYNNLYRAIKSYSHLHILESLWLVKADGEAIDVANHLNQYIDGDDGLFVVESSKNSARKGTICDSETLKVNV